MEARGAIALMREAFDNLLIKHEYFVGPWVLMFYQGSIKGLCIAEIDLEPGKKVPKLPKHLKLGEEITSEPQYDEFELFVKGSKSAREKMTRKLIELKAAAIDIMEEVQDSKPSSSRPIDDSLL